MLQTTRPHPPPPDQPPTDHLAVKYVMIFPNLASSLVMYVNLMYVNVCNMIPAWERERGKTAGDRVSATETETATGTHHSQLDLPDLLI